MSNTIFASRAGEKLEHALNHFQIDVSGKVCADFGSSTGGFVDCLLKRGASKVYAVEKGYGELSWVLRNDPRVVVMERTNAMHVQLPEKVDFLTIDTSWTKQEFILPNALSNLKEGGTIISLIKPHYEADKRMLKKGKLEEADALTVTTDVVRLMSESLQIECLGVEKSPILGKKGENTEYIAVFQQ